MKKEKTYISIQKRVFQKISDDLILVSSNLALSDWNPVCLPLFSTLLRGVECYSQRKQNFVDLEIFNRNLSYASSLPPTLKKSLMQVGYIFLAKISRLCQRKVLLTLQIM